MRFWKRREVLPETSIVAIPHAFSEYDAVLKRLASLVRVKGRELGLSEQIPIDEHAFFKDNLALLADELVRLASAVGKMDAVLVKRSRANPQLTMLREAEVYARHVQEKEKNKSLEVLKVRELDTILVHLVGYKEQLEEYEGEVLHAVGALDVHAIDEDVHRLLEAFRSYNVRASLLENVRAVVNGLKHETVMRDLVERLGTVIRRIQDLIGFCKVYRQMQAFRSSGRKAS